MACCGAGRPVGFGTPVSNRTIVYQLVRATDQVQHGNETYPTAAAALAAAPGRSGYAARAVMVE